MTLAGETVLYAVAAGVAGYYRQSLRRDFNAAMIVRQDIDKVPYAEIINRVAAAEGLDARLVAAVIKAESSFEPKAMSPAGAAGLMQVIPGTWRQVNNERRICSGRHPGDCTLECFYSPELNIRIGVAYLAQLAKQYNGNYVLALAAYNAGPNAVERYGGVPPYAETQGYIKRIIGYWYEFAGRTAPPGITATARWENLKNWVGWLIFGTILAEFAIIWRLVRYYRSWRWR